jgi:hypothetical protein
MMAEEVEKDRFDNEITPYGRYFEPISERHSAPATGQRCSFGFPDWHLGPASVFGESRRRIFCLQRLAI